MWVLKTSKDFYIKDIDIQRKEFSRTFYIYEAKKFTSFQDVSNAVLALFCLSDYKEIIIQLRDDEYADQ